MSKRWQNHEPAPLEFFHGRLMDLFHEYRKKYELPTTFKIDGGIYNNFIAQAKTETYAKYPKLVNNQSVHKSDI